MDFWTILQQEWAIRALLASTMVGLMCGVLGVFLVLRHMSLVGDALGHAILPGVVVAFMIVGYNTLGFFFGAVAAGMITAIGITWIQQNVRTKNDAAIGIVFTAMFSLGVMGISWISHEEGVHLDLKDFLFGNVLGVADQDLWLAAMTTAFVLASVVVLYRPLFVSTFQEVVARTMGIRVQTLHYFLMLMLSFAVVASLQTVGVILVVAMLITPASTALLLSKRLKWVLVWAGLLGVCSAVSGLVVAILLETTPGPAIAVVATLIYLLVALFAPERGLVARLWQKVQLRWRIEEEDVLKHVFRHSEGESPAPATLAKALGQSTGKIKKVLQRLRKKGLLVPDGIRLTEEGKARAAALVRAHRLWETYLARRTGLNPEQIHDDAEHLEHLLPEEILDTIDETLGFPAVDPHGSPIPPKEGLPEHPLNKLRPGQRARIAEHQPDGQVVSSLWRLGLPPGTEVELVQAENGEVVIRYNGRIQRLPSRLSRKVNVEPESPAEAPRS